MTLHRIRGRIEFECDECSEVLITGLEDFSDAVEVLRRQGWTAFPSGIPGSEDGIMWKHRCVDCRQRRAG